MADNRNGSSNTLDAMLKTAGAKLGMSPEALKSTLADPQKANALLGKLGIRAPAADNRQQIEKLLEKNPRARKLLGELLGGKG